MPFSARKKRSCARHLTLFIATHVCIRTSRSEEHTSELQSRENLVCRLLLEKKKKKIQDNNFQLPQQILHLMSALIAEISLGSFYHLITVRHSSMRSLIVRSALVHINTLHLF